MIHFNDNVKDNTNKKILFDNLTKFKNLLQNTSIIYNHNTKSYKQLCKFNKSKVNHFLKYIKIKKIII